VESPVTVSRKSTNVHLETVDGELKNGLTVRRIMQYELQDVYDIDETAFVL
jgi:hypothetical protein